MTWRLTDHTAEAALSHMHMWLKGARLSLEQARDGGGMWNLWLGVLSFVQCAHHARKCMEMASKNVDPQTAEELKEILRAFDEVAPDLRMIRDVLEHYEDGYLLGVGNNQQPELKPWQRQIDPDRADEWQAVPDYVDDEMQEPVVRVSRYELQLVPTLSAVEQMHWSLYVCIRGRDEDPDRAAPSSR